MADGTGVIESAVIGGLSEIIVAYEEYCVPIGQNVMIVGSGPIGLAAVQGTRAQAAGKIIVVEPVLEI